MQQTRLDRLLATPAMRWVLFGIGWIFVIIGIIGVILPGIPGTVFLIMAAWCFTRSSPRFEAWLLNHPKLGPGVVAWRENGAIPRKAKIIAISMMGLSYILMLNSAAPLYACVLAGSILAACAVYVGTRPSA